LRRFGKSAMAEYATLFRPTGCNAMKVECINMMQLIDLEDWVLGCNPG
jgi:hypothetical protein